MDFDENGRAVFSDEERAQIAGEQDQIAARLWEGVTRVEAKGDMRQGGKLRAQACEAEDLAKAARESSAALARIY